MGVEDEQEELLGPKFINGLKRWLHGGGQEPKETRVSRIDLRVQQKSGGNASAIFQFLFWVHQIFLGLPSVGFGFQLLMEGKTQGIISVIGFLLAWIGGTLVWGLAALMHQRPVYDLPRVFAAMEESVERLEAMQMRADSESAVATAVSAELAALTPEKQTAEELAMTRERTETKVCEETSTTADKPPT
jgi:hypothetical protein